MFFLFVHGLDPTQDHHHHRHQSLIPPLKPCKMQCLIFKAPLRAESSYLKKNGKGLHFTSVIYNSTH